MQLYRKEAYDSGAGIGRWWTTDAASAAPASAPVGSWVRPSIVAGYPERDWQQLTTTLVNRLPVEPTWAYSGDEFRTSTGNRLNDLLGGSAHATLWSPSGVPNYGIIGQAGGLIKGPSSGYGEYDGFQLTGLTTTTADREAMSASVILEPYMSSGTAGTSYYGTLLRLGHASAETHVMWDISLRWYYQSGNLCRCQLSIGAQTAAHGWTAWAPDEMWHPGRGTHLVITRSAASGGNCTYTAYVDGRVLVSAAVAVQDTSTTASGALLIGRQTGVSSGAYNGTYANIIVWRDACLNVDQVSHVYAIMGGVA